MNEIDHHREELEELKLEARVAGRVHRSVIGIAATTSAAVFASLPLAVSEDAPPWLTVTMATAGLLGGILAIRETETTKAEFKEAKRKVEDYQARYLISRLRS